MPGAVAASAATHFLLLLGLPLLLLGLPLLLLDPLLLVLLVFSVLTLGGNGKKQRGKGFVLYCVGRDS